MFLSKDERRMKEFGKHVQRSMAQRAFNRAVVFFGLVGGVWYCASNDSGSSSSYSSSSSDRDKVTNTQSSSPKMREEVETTVPESGETESVEVTVDEVPQDIIVNGVTIPAEYAYELAVVNKNNDYTGKGYKSFGKNGVLLASLVDGVEHGSAKLIYNDGDYVYFNFHKGGASGRYYGKVDGAVYMAVFESDRKPWGVVKYDNGDRYEGELFITSRDGLGKMTYADGRVDEGLWDWDTLTVRRPETYATPEPQSGLEP
jgi:hypothetical protein